MEKLVRRSYWATSFVLLFTCTSARAATILWTNTTGGLWSTTANWSPNAVPAATDTAVITNSGTYTVTNDATVTVAGILLGLDPGTNPPVVFARLRHTAGTLTVTNLSVATHAILTLTSPLTVTALGGAGRIDQPSASLRLLGTGVIGTYNFSGGEQRGGVLTVTNFNWTDGNLYSDAAGDRLVVASGGVFNYAGPTDRYLSYYTGPGRRLDNFGTWNWTGPGSLRGQGGAVVINHGTVNVTTNSQFNWGGSGAAPVWINHGTFHRTAGTDFFYFNNVYLTNNGGIYNSAGSLSIYNSTFSNAGPISVTGSQLQFWAASGTNNASVSVAPTTLLTVENGSSVGFGPASSLHVPGYNNARFMSGAVALRTTNVAAPSLWISGATLYQQTNNMVSQLNLSGGTLQLELPATVAQLNQTNGNVQGRTLTVTNWNWYDGYHARGIPGLNDQDDRTIIPAGGVMNLLGTAAHTLTYHSGNGPSRTLDNFGTINWIGNALLYSYGVVNNHGTVTVSAVGTPQYVVVNGNLPPTWNNYGTFTRNEGTVFYFNGAYVNNTGLMNIQQGSLSIYGATLTNHGSINLSANTVFQSENGSVVAFSPSSQITAPTLDSIRLGGAATYLQSTNLNSPSIWQQAGTLYQQTNIVIAKLNLSGGALQLDVPVTLGQLNQTNGHVQGRTLTVTNWNWYDGYHARGTPGYNTNDDRTIIPAGGVMNLLGTAAHTLTYHSSSGPSRTLDNFGTINWSGNALLYSYGVVNNHGSVNVSAIGAPQYVYANGNLPPTWNNYGTFTRSAGTVFHFQGAYVNNTGLMNIQQGALSIYNATLTNHGQISINASALFQSEAGSVVTFSPSSQITAPTLDSIRLGGATTYLQSTNVLSPSLWQQAGTLYQQTNIVVAKLNLSGGALQLDVPATLAQLNQTNGHVQGRNLTVTNWNWYDGYHFRGTPGYNTNDDRTIIPVGGVMNLLGTASRYLSYYSATGPSRTLDNFGMINWTGNALLYSYGVVNNHGSVNVSAVGSPQYVYVNGNLPPTWNNYGTFGRSAGTVFHFQGAYVNNTGLMNIQQGTLSIYNATLTNHGQISLNANALFQSEVGSVVTFSPSSQITAPTLDSIRLGGATTYLQSTNVLSPSLWQQAGTLYQQTNIVVAKLNLSGGALQLDVPATLAELNQTNGYVQGRNLTVTNWNWYDGVHYRGTPGYNTNDDRTIIPAGGVMNLMGAANHTLSYYSATGPSRTLDNFGTINWTGNALLYSYGTVNNHGSVNVTADGTAQYVYYSASVPPTWNNYGTFTRSAGSLFYFQGGYVNNTGLMNVQQGTLSIYAATLTNHPGGQLQAGSGAIIANDVGSETYLLPGSLVSGASPNALQVNSGNVHLQTIGLSLPSLLITGGTLHQETNSVAAVLNQSGGSWRLHVPTSIASYNLTNGELRGANLTITNFNWQGGSLSSENAGSNTVTIPASGTLAISSATAKGLSDYSGGNGRRLFNFGNATWSGANVTLSHGGRFINQGSLTLTSDAGFVNGGGTGTPTFENIGSFTKTNSSGVATFSGVNVTNSGSLTIPVGGLSVGGVFIQTAGVANLGTNFALNSNARIEAGSFSGRGNFAGTAYNNGVFNPGASPGLVTGTSFTNSAGSTLNLELGGLSGGTDHDQLRLTGTAVLGGNAVVTLVNNFAPQLSNRFTIITCASRSGMFASVVPPPGVTFDTIYSPTNVILEIIGLTNAPLEITSFPSNQTVWTPDPVTFSVSVSGVTPIAYQWQRFGTNLPNATNAAFTIPAVAAADAGTYTVHVTDGVGGTTNASALLTVIPFAGTIYWTNVAGGDWSVAANWLPSRVPNATNTAMILSNGTYTVSISSAAAVSNLVVGLPSNVGTQTLHLVTGHTLALGGNSAFATNTIFALNGTLQTAGGSNHIAGRIDWQLGTLSGAGRTVIATNATLTFYGSLNQKLIITNVLENYGTFFYGNDSFGNAQGPQFSGGAHLTNYPSGIIHIGTAAYQYAGSQTPRSYLVNRGRIQTASANVFSPAYISIDFLNHGVLENGGYTYLSRGSNFGTFRWLGCCLSEISVFGDDVTGEYFSFEDGTVFEGDLPNLAVGGYAQWNTTAVHPGNVRVLSGSGGASFNDPEFRILKNYTQTGTTSVNKGRWTLANSNLTASLNVMNDGIVNGFHSFVISNAGTIYVNQLSHAIRNLANGGTIIVKSNLTLSGGATHATGRIVMTNGATGTFSGGSVDAQSIENYGTNSVTGDMSFSGNTRYRNRPGARTWFGGGTFVTGPASMLNESLVDGFGGVSINFTNRATVLANDPLNRNLALGTYVQELGFTENGPGSVSGTLDIVGGSIVGTNSITGSLRSAGTASPGKPFGLLSISGNYTNQPTGLETVVIAGAKAVTNFPQVQVSGTAYLGGTLSVAFTNGFLPAPGNLFTVMVYSARSGVFNHVINPEYQLEAFYTPTNLVLRAENLLPTVNLTVVGGSTQLVCNPFKLTASASDPDGVVTNLTMFMNGSTLAAGGSGGALNPAVESDFPAPIVFTARAIDERGGVRWATQTAQLVTHPLHTLTLGGFRSNNSAFKICMLGQNGSDYVVFGNTNLNTTNWASLGPMHHTNGIWRFFDAGTFTNRPVRFYRAQQQ